MFGHRKILFFSLVAIFASLVFSACAGLKKTNDVTAGWPKICSDVPGVENARYCVFRTSAEPERIVWYFHGLHDKDALVESYFEHASLKKLLGGIGPAVVVGVSYGNYWMLKPNADASDPLSVTAFVEKVMPAIERAHDLHGPRLAIGHSMGGSNVATLCALMPDLFSSCVLTNPMLLNAKTDPFAGFFTRITRWCPACAAPRQSFTKEEWQKANPIALLAAAKNLPRSFVTACRQDVFNLFDGAQEWVKAAAFKGFDVSWVPVDRDCSHFEYRVDELLEFIRERVPRARHARL